MLGVQPLDTAALLAIIDELRREVLELRAEVASLKAQLAERDAQLAERDAQLAERDAQLAQRDATISVLTLDMTALSKARDEAERKARMDSSNSSKPPSSDPPWSAPKQSPTARNRAKRERKKQGAQKGHKGHHRELLPPEQVNEIVESSPAACGKCGGTRLVVDPAREPWRHQVVDIVDGRKKVVEHRCLGAACADCGHFTPASLPPNVPPFALGATLCAVIALLTGKYRLSRRRTRELLIDLLGIEVSLGAISECEARITEALEAPMREAEEYIRTQDVVGLDETSHREKAVLFWLWVAVTPLVVVYNIAARRTAAVAKAILGEGFAGTIVTDQHGGYDWVPSTRRQLCWAHLYRKFIGFSEARDKAKGGVRWHGKRLVAATEKLFRWWHAVRDGTMTRDTFETRMRGELIPRMNRLLLEAAESELPKLGRACADLYLESESLWLFVDNRSLPLTNNASEQEIRDGSIRRKTSFGTQSDRGSRFLERMLTVSASCRRQKRNVLAFLVDAYQATLSGTVAPSLLPQGGEG
jgi:transposase